MYYQTIFSFHFQYLKTPALNIEHLNFQFSKDFFSSIIELFWRVSWIFPSEQSGQATMGTETLFSFFNTKSALFGYLNHS